MLRPRGNFPIFQPSVGRNLFEGSVPSGFDYNGGKALE